MSSPCGGSPRPRLRLPSTRKGDSRETFSAEAALGHTRRPRDPRPDESANRVGERGTETLEAITRERPIREEARRNPGRKKASRQPKCTSRKCHPREDCGGRSEANCRDERSERSLSWSRAEIPRNRWHTADTSVVGASHRRRSFSDDVQHPCHAAPPSRDRPRVAGSNDMPGLWRSCRNGYRTNASAGVPDPQFCSAKRDNPSRPE